MHGRWIPSEGQPVQVQYDEPPVQTLPEGLTSPDIISTSPGAAAGRRQTLWKLFHSGGHYDASRAAPLPLRGYKQAAGSFDVTQPAEQKRAPPRVVRVVAASCTVP
ncbi:hypothetical protein NDU88_006621 [Pleurodeles waltl]|uniref:Uncharacterized protein n=1 Tax=Pleurodeles waltl TaxID=8319 RepID=A0AAV7QII6_PLEWA|nr:hypothetical protein NDU88_006621 [Pleurodeles waltl]